MRKLLRKCFLLFYRIYALRVISRDSICNYKQVTVKVPKGVFHPGLFFSSILLIEEWERRPLNGKSFLELGCGSGLISIIAAKNGAITTAIDINSEAVRITEDNAKSNEVDVEVLQSDLFSALPKRKFDIIAINPPYYKKNPVDHSGAAWYAGENLEYFQKLFLQIEEHTHANSIVLMVVSEDVSWKDVVKLAAQQNITFSLACEKVICFEKNFIYELIFNANSTNTTLLKNLRKS